ncbi:unnamed protein product (mitochondrion) [Plasmodiophora brassicae]|uniref:methionyl-tRNA formyltransferase n=2 Tax=Plasmodiophora brassicae TaxID=37360 RepID=A0A3P3YDX5_PLABS|nr:unnamed protein product [Plasmodiophora brassicae]
MSPGLPGAVTPSMRARQICPIRSIFRHGGREHSAHRRARFAGSARWVAPGLCAGPLSCAPMTQRLIRSRNPSVLFFGSDEFACVSLRAIMGVCSVQGVVAPNTTRLPAPTFAVASGLRLYTGAPHCWDTLPKNVDVGVVVSFGHKIPDRVIGSFRYGMVNVHPSLLPMYRGSSPIQTALLDGVSETGVCVIEVASRMDSGRILSSRRVPVDGNDTYRSLRDRLAVVGSELLVNVVADVERAQRGAIQQGSAEGLRRATKLHSDHAAVDFETMSSDDIYRHWRAFYGFIHVHAAWRERKRLLLIEVDPPSRATDEWALPPGEFVYDMSRDRIIIGCRDGTHLAVAQLQVSTRKIVSAVAFAHGYHIPRRRLLSTDLLRDCTNRT